MSKRAEVTEDGGRINTKFDADTLAAVTEMAQRERRSLASMVHVLVDEALQERKKERA